PDARSRRLADEGNRGTRSSRSGTVENPAAAANGKHRSCPGRWSGRVADFLLDVARACGVAKAIQRAAACRYPYRYLGAALHARDLPVHGNLFRCCLCLFRRLPKAARGIAPVQPSGHRRGSRQSLAQRARRGETAMALVLLASAGVLLKSVLVMRSTAP